MRVSNAAGFTIDWLLNSMNPLGLAVLTLIRPGTRDVVIDITPQAVATLPNAEQTIFIDYSGPAGAQPNTNSS